MADRIESDRGDVLTFFEPNSDKLTKNSNNSEKTKNERKIAPVQVNFRINKTGFIQVPPSGGSLDLR